jgi:hypothetical protein
MQNSIGRRITLTDPQVAIILVFLAALSGCSALPNSIAEPTISLPATPSADHVKGVYLVNGKAVSAYGTTDFSSSILPVETTKKGIQTQILALRGAYRERQQELLGENDFLSNSQFAGVLIAAAGIATHGIPVRNTGAGIAGLSSFWATHYQVMVQAKNYKVAADGLDCAYRKIDAIPDSFFNAAYDPDSGLLYLSEDDLVAQDPSLKSGYDALAGLFSSLNSSVYQIDQQLRSLQSSLTIASVSVADIESVVTKNRTASAAADNSGGLTTNAVSKGGIDVPGTDTSKVNNLMAAFMDLKNVDGATATNPPVVDGASAKDVAAARLKSHLKQFGKIQSAVVGAAVKLPTDVQTCATAVGGT